ncbi:YD repeat-containing protein, partial [Solimonas aquatica]
MPSRLLLLLAVACFSSTVWAQQKCGPDDSGPPSCEASGPASQSDPKANAGAGNPVNLISGNKYQREVDLPALPGVLGLEIVRHYNSALAGERSPSGVLGRGWRLSYETELHAFSHSIQILQADGRHLQFSRDPQQPNLCASPDPAQGTVRIKTTAQGEEYTWHWPDGRQLHFDRQGRLEEIRAPTGEALSLLYAPDGKLLRITDPQGRQLRLEYLDRQAAARNERFRGVQAIDSPVGRFVYHHDDTRSRQTLANLTAVDYPSMGEAKSGRVYHYEAPRFAAYLTGISVTDGSKAPTRLSHYGYDDNGLAISSEHGPQSVRLDRHPGTVRITDDAGRQTHFDYAVVAGQYRILEVRGAGCPGCGPAQRRYGYDPLGRRQTQTRLDDQGQAQETIKTTRDPQGRIRTIERIAYLKGKAQPAQRLAEYRYQGEPLQTLTITRPSVVAGRQMLTQLSYDDHGQVTAIEQSGWSPSPAGQPQRIERSTRYRYADIGGRSRLSEIDGPLANGPKNDPSDSDITQYHYGTKGRVATIVYPGWRELQIDNEENGRPRARIVRFEGIEQSIALGYDAMDRLTRFTGPDGNAIALSYDAAGILKPVSLPDGRILSLVSAEKLRPLMLDEQSGFTLGGAGSVAQEAVVRFEANGKTAERLIDDFGRVVAIHNPGQNWQTAQYDTADRLIQIIDPRGAEARAHYDLANRLQQVERLAPGASEPESIITLAWSGPRKTADTITDVDGRRTTRYLHDARGRIASVTLSIEPAGAKPITLTQRFEHDAEGRLLLQTLPSGQRLHYAYGERGQITITAETGPQWLMDWLPERWRPGVTLAERPPSSDVRADAGILSELPAEAIEPGLSEHAPGEAFDAAGYPGRLTTSQGELRLIWNAAGQLVEVTNARGRRVARYAYDAQGRRVSKVTNQGTVYFFHDGTRLTAVADGQGAIKSEYAYQGLRPVAWLKPDARTRWYQMATLYRLQTDHRGALVAVQSETGEALWTAELDAWGRLRNPADTRFDPKLRLVAQYADDETGLFYHLARYYDPAQGR